MRRPISPFLDAWLSHDWTAGLQTEDLAEQEFLTVETENSRYELTILCGRTGDVLVRGGQFFHTRRRRALREVRSEAPS